MKRSLYRITELSEKARKRALFEIRYINIQGYWWKGIINPIVAILNDVDMELVTYNIANQYIETNFKFLLTDIINWSCNPSLKHHPIAKILKSTKEDLYRIKAHRISKFNYGMRYYGKGSFLDYEVRVCRKHNHYNIESLINATIRRVKTMGKEIDKCILKLLTEEFNHRTSFEAIIKTAEEKDYLFLKNGELP